MAELEVPFGLNHCKSRVWFDRLGGGDATAPAKQGVQVRQVVAAMEAMEGRIVELIQALVTKVEGVSTMSSRLDTIDHKLAQQGNQLEKMQVKVDLSMTSLGQVQMEQVVMAKAMKAAVNQASPSASPTSEPPLLDNPPGASTSRAPQFSPKVSEPSRPSSPTVREFAESGGRRNWMPKMDFPKFDGTDARVWVDNCETYFNLYQITEGFKVSAASLNMVGDAAHWYQAWKREVGWHTWDQLQEAIFAEFEIHTARFKMDELLLLSQTGTVSEYRTKFAQLVYYLRLYDPTLSTSFLLSQFVKGLKEELRFSVLAQLPEDVNQAYRVALAFESALQLKKGVLKKDGYQHKVGDKVKPAMGEIWKAQQLKEYRKTHGLCFKCGEKYSPAHVCAKPEVAQLKAIELAESTEILSDEVLDAMVQMEEPQEDMLLSLHAIAGSISAKTIQLRALINNQVVLILVDSGSSHSFVNEVLCQKLQLSTTELPPSSVRVANGEFLQCMSQVPDFQWWIQGYTFHFPIKVLPMGGYDMVLGMDWLEQHSPMQCDWETKSISFSHNGQWITLQGIQHAAVNMITTVSPEQVMKWYQGNDIWALAVVEDVSSSVQLSATPPDIQQLIQKYHLIFQTPAELPPHRVVDHSISLLPGAVPVNCRPYRYSPAQKDEIEKQVIEMLNSGLITQSCSPFASPVLLVKKKDNTWRFCVDYRKLNSLTVKNKFPLPIVDELLDELAGAQYFSKLDLKSGYHQIRMKEEDEHKTAFKTHHGHFQFRVMPFGLTNAPATFQYLMNSVFAPYMRKFVLVFMDDILVYSSSWSEHLRHLELVFQVLQHHHLFAKLSKCSFAAPTLEYLGHIISKDGVATDPAKTECMAKWPTPSNVTELRGFLGLTGYYRKFVHHYGILAKPLTKLLQKNVKFCWTPEVQNAFVALKTAMCSTPVLALPDFSKSFILETDACDSGIGAVLLQEGHPIAFYSKALGSANSKLSIYEKEFLAIMMAVSKWRSYLLRGPFIIKTDHQSLCHLNDQALETDLQRKAMTKLIGLQYQFQYKKGVDNTVADALSRVHHTTDCFALSAPHPLWLQELLNSYAVDPKAQQLLTELAITGSNDQGFTLAHGLIRQNGRIWVGANSALQTKLIHAFHNSAMGGHSGSLVTYHRLKKLFAWPGLKQHVEEYVQQCSICQQAKHELCKYPGLLQPLPIPEGAWQEISMDFIEGLPVSKGYDVIFVVVDRYTKYAHFIPLKHPFSRTHALDRIGFVPEPYNLYLQLRIVPS